MEQIEPKFLAIDTATFLQEGVGLGDRAAARNHFSNVVAGICQTISDMAELVRDYSLTTLGDVAQCSLRLHRRYHIEFMADVEIAADFAKQVNEADKVEFAKLLEEAVEATWRAYCVLEEGLRCLQLKLTCALFGRIRNLHTTAGSKNPIIREQIQRFSTLIGEK